VKGALSEASDFVNLTASTPTVDLSVTKKADKEAYAIGETVTYTINFANAGPSDANGAVIKDVIPASLTGVSVSTTYAGGAGTGTPTPAQLAAGWIVATLPSGGSGVLTVTGVTSVAGVFTNAVNIAAPAGRVDTNSGNNNALVVISVNPKAKKCVDIEVSTTSQAMGAGISFAAIPTSFDVNGNLTIQMRDFTSIPLGGYTSLGGGAPSYLQKTFTNNRTVPAVYEVELFTKDVFSAGNASVGKMIKFIHKLSDILAIPSVLGYNADRDTIVNQVFGISNTNGANGENTSGVAKMIFELLPGQSKTIFAQWWIQINKDQNITTYIGVEGGMQMDWKIYYDGSLV
jgi:uncharacterized repeat protein (TIGR01451 family)